jgi:hypothetical protein
MIRGKVLDSTRVLRLLIWLSLPAVSLLKTVLLNMTFPIIQWGQYNTDRNMPQGIPDSTRVITSHSRVTCGSICIPLYTEHIYSLKVWLPRLTPGTKCEYHVQVTSAGSYSSILGYSPLSSCGLLKSFIFV